MNDKRIVRQSGGNRRKDETDWDRVNALTDKEIEEAARSDPDAAPTDLAFWKDARIVWPERKVPVSLRLDPEIVHWFKAQGRGYQTRINAVLRAYMDAHKKTKSAE